MFSDVVKRVFVILLATALMLVAYTGCSLPSTSSINKTTSTASISQTTASQASITTSSTERPTVWETEFGLSVNDPDDRKNYISIEIIKTDDGEHLAYIHVYFDGSDVGRELFTLEMIKLQIPFMGVKSALISIYSGDAQGAMVYVSEGYQWITTPMEPDIYRDVDGEAWGDEAWANKGEASKEADYIVRIIVEHFSSSFLENSSTTTTSHDGFDERGVKETELKSGEIFDFFAQYGEIYEMSDIKKKSGVTFMRVQYFISDDTILDIINQFHNLLTSIISNQDGLDSLGYNYYIINLYGDYGEGTDMILITYVEKDGSSTKQWKITEVEVAAVTSIKEVYEDALKYSLFN